ncbi:MAG: MFS transporter, partial [Muribaculaceae bacterium]|nr:MFS transporter [Muribaculaceae bacterium]
MKGIKGRLTIMNFLEFAVWGSYLTSMGGYLAQVGLQEYIGWFYAVQGIVSLFMPALIGIIADRFMSAHKVLSLCHLIAGLSMLGVGAYAFSSPDALSFPILFGIYTLSVAFFMPTIGLSNSVAYSALNGAGLDTIKHFPSIRIFGTIGFICAMLLVDFLGFQHNPAQFYTSGVIGLILSLYALSLPACPVSKG